MTCSFPQMIYQQYFVERKNQITMCYFQIFYGYVHHAHMCESKLKNRNKKIIIGVENNIIIVKKSEQIRY